MLGLSVLPPFIPSGTLTHRLTPIRGVSSCLSYIRQDVPSQTHSQIGFCCDSKISSSWQSKLITIAPLSYPEGAFGLADFAEEEEEEEATASAYGVQFYSKD